MTEKELKELYFLNKETEQLQKELRALELEIKQYDGYKGSRLSHAPKGGVVDTYDKLTDMLDDTIILKDAIALNFKRIQRVRVKLEKYIGKIKNAEIRLIFRLRHVNGMTWEGIGRELSMERTTVAKKYRRFLKVSHNSRS